jgi:hypothetical protein
MIPRPSRVIPAKAGTQEHRCKRVRMTPCSWVPAFAGMTPSRRIGS